MKLVIVGIVSFILHNWDNIAFCNGFAPSSHAFIIQPSTRQEHSVFFQQIEALRTTCLMSSNDNNEKNDELPMTTIAQKEEKEEKIEWWKNPIPLLDLTDSPVARRAILPLPSNHLPTELTSLNMYGIHLTSMVHKMLIQDAIRGEATTNPERLYGHIISKPNAENNNNNGEKEIDLESLFLEGAIGCTSQVLIQAELQRDNDDEKKDGEARDMVDELIPPPIAVMYRGYSRFRVINVMKTFPYPLAMVEPLEDTDNGMASSSKATDSSLLGDSISASLHYLNSAELCERVISATRAYLDSKLDLLKEKSPLSPVEQSMMEANGLPVVDIKAQREQYEESIAILDVFWKYILESTAQAAQEKKENSSSSSSIPHKRLTPRERNFAVAMLAAEITSLDNDVRREIITMTDSVQRLRIVCHHVETKARLEAEKERESKKKQREMSGSIPNLGGSVISTIPDIGQADKKEDDNNDDGTTPKSKSKYSHNLQVGEPELPQWATQIEKGTRVEYFWNEEHGWCSGQVCRDPIRISNEILLEIQFDDAVEGETYRLPFNPGEKLRWRPLTHRVVDEEDLPFQ